MPPTKHALLGASSAERWLNCTPSARLCENLPDRSSVYAEEGTLAHAICEQVARKRFLPDTYNAEELSAARSSELYQTEMERCAEKYVNALDETFMAFNAPPTVAFEVQVDFSEYVPEGFGTCDCVMIGVDTLIITDYKHGKGISIDCEENSQMRLYALGALHRYRAVYSEIKYVTMQIVQPRLHETPCSETVTIEELLAWGNRIKPVAAAAFAGTGEFVPGEHCRFCKAKAVCRKRAEQATAISDFGMVSPVTLSSEEIGEAIKRGAPLKKWLEDVQEYASAEILAGRSIPGWKLVEGRSVRSFSNQDDAFDAIIKSGYEEPMLYDRKPKSLTEVEKMMGKKPFAEVCGAYIVKPPGKPTLAPNTDSRPAFNSAISDFSGVL